MNNSISIEIAVKKDLPEILALQKLAFYDVAKFYNNFKLHPLLTTLEEIEKSFPKYTYFIAKINSQIIGSARAYQNNSLCKIENVIVHPNFQNKGIGTKLMRELENDFDNSKEFELFTGKETPNNVEFYKRLEYKIIKEIDATENKPILVVMSKTNKKME